MTGEILDLKSLAYKVFETLGAEGVHYALAGGLLADLYRGEVRGTGDIDVVVALEERHVSQAQKIIEHLGYSASFVTAAQLQGATRFSKRSPTAIVVGRNPNEPFGVDFILLTLPWTKDALERAQYNRIGYAGYAHPIPSLTVEDLLIAKMFAIKNHSKRRYEKSDIPDIALILKNNSNIDYNYLQDRMLALELVLPQVLERDAPPLLYRTSRRVRRKNRALFDY